MQRRVLSKIDRLPDAARPALEIAQLGLDERRKTQLELLAELNATLANLGIPAVSSSAFFRWTIRQRCKKQGAV